MQGELALGRCDVVLHALGFVRWQAVHDQIDGLRFGGLIADKAFDANWIIKEMNRRDARICIALRTDKTDTSFEAMIYTNAAVISTR